MRVSLFDAISAVAIGVLALTICGWGSIAAQTDDPSLGTWKLDVAKSKYSPGPAPKSENVKYEKVGDSFRRTIDGVDAQARATHTEVTFKYDGKEYPVKGGSYPQTITFKRIDDRTMELVSRTNGKVTFTSRRVISRDGKTATTTQTGTDAQGRAVNNTLVLVKQ